MLQKQILRIRVCGVNTTDGSRPGGRSARVQQAVHDAVHKLLRTMPREGVTVPAIAAAAGVTPSTIYRRWGDLASLMSDIAADRFKTTETTVESGSLRGDLAIWSEQFLDEMGSTPGRSYIVDVLAGDKDGDNSGLCVEYARRAVEEIVGRVPKSERPSVESILDYIVAPMMYRIVFDPNRIPPGYSTRLVETFLSADLG